MPISYKRKSCVTVIKPPINNLKTFFGDPRIDHRKLSVQDSELIFAAVDREVAVINKPTQTSDSSPWPIVKERPASFLM